MTIWDALGMLFGGATMVGVAWAFAWYSVNEDREATRRLELIHKNQQDTYWRVMPAKKEPKQ